MLVRLLALAICLPSLLPAATVTPVGPLPYDDTHVQARDGCTHRMDGVVERGDLAQFQALKTDPQVVVCLDSPGGSFMEGILIGEYLREARIGTRLEAGAQCLSACSIIFMSGTYEADVVRFGDQGNDWQLGPKPWRSMHPTARLGFHAPKLNVPSGQYNEETVTKAYDIALLTLAEFSQRLMETKNTGDNLFDPDLFTRMIATPHDQMMFIDTAGLAGRFWIEVGPMQQPTQMKADGLIDACVNYYSYMEPSEAEIHAASRVGATVAGNKVTLSGYGLDCGFEKPGQDSVWRIYNYDVPDLYFYPSDTPLPALAR